MKYLPIGESAILSARSTADRNNRSFLKELWQEQKFDVTLQEAECARMGIRTTPSITDLRLLDGVFESVLDGRPIKHRDALAVHAGTLSLCNAWGLQLTDPNSLTVISDTSTTGLVESVHESAPVAVLSPMELVRGILPDIAYLQFASITEAVADLQRIAAEAQAS